MLDAGGGANSDSRQPMQMLRDSNIVTLGAEVDAVASQLVIGGQLSFLSGGMAIIQGSPS